MEIQPHNELVIFDLDDTLLSGQSQEELLRYLRHAGLVPALTFVLFSFWIVAYRLGCIRDPERVMRKAYRLLKGKSAADIEEHMRHLFSSRLRALLYTEGVSLLERHKRDGRVVLLLSNSPDFLVHKVAAYLGIPHVIATRLEVRNGRFTGNIVGAVVYGKQKLCEAESFARERGIHLATAWAYGDHSSDLHLLRKVGHPVAVNPDVALKEEAEERSWPILLFKRKVEER
jgi:HAD superfamily hydrolase (TIGR01490 family)